jgi:hypothetical protein
MLDAEPNGTLPNGMVFRYVSRRYGTYANICHVSDIYA